MFDAIVLSNGWDDATTALQVTITSTGRCPKRGIVDSDAPAGPPGGN